VASVQIILTRPRRKEGDERGQPGAVPLGPIESPTDS
jgi:hypothetical protein